jgi:hypothetical protein
MREFMYIQPDNQQRGLVRARSGSTTFYTLLCFSLAGLIMGFAIGGFAGHLSHSLSAGSGSSSSLPTLTGHNPNAARTATPENIFLGVPRIAAGDYTSPETADGTTSYLFAAQIVNKADQKPITATDAVCRLWLTTDLQGTSDALSANNFALPRNLASFHQPFPQEIEGALTFSSSSPQTQPCAVNGKTKWSYTLASSVPSGTCYLAVLADWKGIHYNWYMVAIKVYGNGNGNNDGNGGNNGNGNGNGNNDGNGGNNGNGNGGDGGN